MEQKRNITAGDIVAFGNTIGHVYMVGDYKAWADAYFTDTQHTHILINEFSFDLSTTQHRPASDKESQTFQNALSKVGYYAVAGDARLHKIKVWQPGTWVSVTKCGVTVLGILTEYEFSKSVVLSASLDGQLTNYTFSPLEAEIHSLKIGDKKKAMAEFDAAGYFWDAKRMEAVRRLPRAAAGQMYWSITDRLTIRCEADNQTGKHDQRYAAGNYFLSPEEANAALQHLFTYLQDHHPQHSQQVSASACLHGSKAL